MWILKSASFKLTAKSSVAAAPNASAKPNEFLANAITFTSEVNSVTLNPLLEKALRLTWNGLVETGNATTFDAYPASKPTATIGAKYKESVVDDKTTTFAPSFCAACLTTSAYALALNLSNLLSVTFSTLSTPYFPNSETSPALTVTAVTVVPNDSAIFFA